MEQFWTKLVTVLTGIPVEFYQNFAGIPNIYFWITSGIPLEYDFKIVEGQNCVILESLLISIK